MVSDAVLMDMFSRAVGWQNFAATMAIEQEIKEAELESEIAYAEAQALIVAWEAAPVLTGARGAQRTEFNTTAAKAQREVDPKVQDLKASLRTAYAARKRAQVVRDNAERVANVVSRELTRRIGRDPVERKAQRYT